MKKKLFTIALLIAIISIISACNIYWGDTITKVELKTAPNGVISTTETENLKNLGKAVVVFTTRGSTTGITAELNLATDAGEPSLPTTLTITGVTPNVISIAYSDEKGGILTNYEKTTVGKYTIRATFTYNNVEIGSINFDYRVVAKKDDANFDSGTGADAANPYVITNAQELSNLRNVTNTYYYYILKNDIDLSGINWIPIGETTVIDLGNGSYEVATVKGFMGDFNGNNKKIINLTMKSNHPYIENDTNNK
ncbi:MAG: hypothetical protein RR316_02085, partial [Clostridia bacterium]